MEPSRHQLIGDNWQDNFDTKGVSGELERHEFREERADLVCSNPFDDRITSSISKSNSFPSKLVNPNHSAHPFVVG